MTKPLSPLHLYFSYIRKAIGSHGAKKRLKRASGRQEKPLLLVGENHYVFVLEEQSVITGSYHRPMAAVTTQTNGSAGYAYHEDHSEGSSPWDFSAPVEQEVCLILISISM